MKIGDKVRFLSEIGGGFIAGFQGKNIVLVEDEDGFQVPMLTNEVVVIGDEDYSTANMVDKKAVNKNTNATSSTVEIEKPITFKPQPQERRGGDVLSA